MKKWYTGAGDRISFEEILEAAMKTPNSAPVATPTSVVEDDDE